MSGNRHGDRSTAALTHPEDGVFSDGTAPGFQFLAFVFVGFLAADVGFVAFDNPAKHLEIGRRSASRMRRRTNQADFCVIPISFDSCMDEMPLRAVTSRYMA